MAEGSAVIVVGVDGSAGCVDALRWAIRQAQATGAQVRAVAAWHVPASFDYGPTFDDFDWKAFAQKNADAAVAEASTAGQPVTVMTKVVQGHPGTVLVEDSREADLLVVGSRGHGTAVGMLLGSVSLYCVHHATCPIVVVHAPAR